MLCHYFKDGITSNNCFLHFIIFLQFISTIFWIVGFVETWIYSGDETSKQE